jgi:hypothetical protein
MSHFCLFFFSSFFLCLDNDNFRDTERERERERYREREIQRERERERDREQERERDRQVLRNEANRNEKHYWIIGSCSPRRGKCVVSAVKLIDASTNDSTLIDFFSSSTNYSSTFNYPNDCPNDCSSNDDNSVCFICNCIF